MYMLEIQVYFAKNNIFVFLIQNICIYLCFFIKHANKIPGADAPGTPFLRVKLLSG